MRLAPFTRISLLPIYFRRMDARLEAPWRLAFITVVQFMEGLPDRQAADAVRGRIDLKYALGLALSDPGFDFPSLSDFRKRLVEGEAEELLLEAMLASFKEQGWRKRTAAPTDRLDTCAGQACERSTDSCASEKRCALR
jgi:hypothetical protein